jgi:hypothetical protein
MIFVKIHYPGLQMLLQQLLPNTIMATAFIDKVVFETFGRLFEILNISYGL